MNSRFILTLGLASILSSASFAGPGVQYWQQRGAERARAANAPRVVEEKEAQPCCRVAIVRKPVGPQKASISTKKVECPGCPEMKAGEKCLTG